MLTRRGFTLLEAVVITALIAIGAGVLIPALSSAVSRARADRARSRITEIETAIGNFRVAVGVAPGMVSHVTQFITGNDRRGCSANNANLPAVYTTGGGANVHVKAWRNSDANHGPWMRDQLIPRAIGVRFVDGFGFLVDTLYRTNNSTPTVGGFTRTGNTVVIVIRGVTLADAHEVDLLVDGAVNASAGAVQWGSYRGYTNPINQAGEGILTAGTVTTGEVDLLKLNQTTTTPNMTCGTT